MLSNLCSLDTSPSTKASLIYFLVPFINFGINSTDNYFEFFMLDFMNNPSNYYQLKSIENENNKPLRSFDMKTLFHLYFFCHGLNTNSFKNLVENEVETEDDLGNTPFHYFCKNHCENRKNRTIYFDILKYFLAHEYHLDSPNYDDVTPLSLITKSDDDPFYNFVKDFQDVGSFWDKENHKFYSLNFQRW